MHLGNFNIVFCSLIMASWVIEVTFGEEKLGCASIDKAAIKKKVFDAMINSVEAMYKDTSVFRKKKSTQTKGETAAISDVFILPLEIQRFHEKAVKSRRSFFQSKHVKDDIAVSKIAHTTNSKDDSEVQVTEAEGKKVGVAEAILQRSKRFCVPTTYNEKVRAMVEKIVNETFLRIELP